MVKHYLFLAVSQVFFSFFLVLFFISSIVLLIGIASVTMVIKVSFLDLVQLFLYSMPGTIFFILPITFFAACALGLSRLSYDHELLVFFSLGISPKKMTEVFVPISILVSVILLVFSLILIPTSKSAYYGFLRQKKDKIDINIREGEFGQKLGDWLVYVDRAKDNSYDNLVLFSNKSLSQESFILAQKGNINNKDGVFELNLYNGNAYFAQDDKMRKIDFDELHLRNKLKSFNSKDAAYLQGTDYIGYWKRAFGKEANKSQRRRFSQAILVSLFPLASVFLIPLFGIANPRFKTNLSYVYVLGAIGIYFLMVHVISTDLFVMTFLFPFIWAFISYLLFKKFILKRY
ncbi:LptF/LptG family permease [Helicobacter cetorum]|uniref:Permease n=1 Tax=Helicobacter cetorum (strain ATCC BAA-429 / MIT 00-7128) TaxID=182217 RepID=I0EPE0_HELC0|nr:LptF/LptG family permease [Helicobacter cetorum]AFI04809.1 hypothetical protein HCW_07760 [Helicobacter cetorum MIT 00-7128]